MAQLQKLEGQVELKCSADKLFEMVVEKEHHIPNICSDKIPDVKADHHDLGITTKWVCVIDGKPQELLSKIKVLDDKSKMIHWDVIDAGEIMKTHYKTMETKLQAIAKGVDCCMVKYSIEYEKLDEVAPEPHKLLHFSLNVFKDLGSHLANALLGTLAT